MTENSMPDKITSSLDITNWFCRKAEQAAVRLGDSKIQHLLFLSQAHFALKFGQPLMPSLFVCSRSGFYEPTIRGILKFGLPLMSEPRLGAKTENFLDLVWQKYAKQSETELERFILSLDCWKHFYRPEAETIVNPAQFGDSFAASFQPIAPNDSPKSKILMSQNGPVRVSAWHPRKLNSSNP